MAISPTEPGQMPALRLVRPEQAVNPTRRADPAPVQTPVRRTESDSFDFQSVQQAARPVTSLAEARRKLEAIREQLVAARTDRPMNFDQPPVQPKTNSPAIQQYLKIQSSITPTERNIDATESDAQRT